jgi:hypothetical protein
MIYGIAMAAILMGGALNPGLANAGSVTFTASGSDSDGPLAASITFTAINGGFDITVTNTETGTFAKGQAISDFSFSVGGTLSTPTAFTEQTGVMFNPVSGGSWTLASGTAFDTVLSPTPPQPYAINHWGFQTTGASVVLATAGSPVPGAGNPTWMILPSTGTAGPGNSLANSNFFPFIIGPTNFFLTVPGVTSSTDLNASNILNVTLSFGTGPDKVLPGTVVPEPSSVVMGAMGFIGLIGVLARRLGRKV